MEFALSLYDALVIAVLTLILVNIALNLLAFPTMHRRTVRASAAWQALPLVSVLVPARNEEQRIRKCLRSLATQTYPNYEVIVLDDCSTDDTVAVVKELGFSEEGHGRLQMARGQPLPKGWVGKPWACYQLSRLAQGEYLLFTDADTVHEPESIESAVAMSLKEQAHLLSAWPRQITVTLAEKLVVPLLYVLGIGFVPHWLLRRAQRLPALARRLPERFYRDYGGANGQFLLFTRDAYKQMGSHQLVKDQLVEDVELGREVASRIPGGWRLVNCDGRKVVACRMYRSFTDVWEGFSKNVRLVFAARWKFVVLGLIFCFALTLPFIWIFLRQDRWIVFLQLQLILLIRLALAVRFQTSWLGVLLHPIGCLLGMAIGANSSRWTKSRRIFWRGRQYDPGEL